MALLKKLSAIASGGAILLLATASADKADALSVTLNSYNPSTGVYSYGFQLNGGAPPLGLAETDVFSGLSIPPLVFPDQFTLTGLTGVTGAGVVSRSDISKIFTSSSFTPASATFTVAPLVGVTASLVGPGNFGTFTVTAPNTTPGLVNYGVDTTITASVLPQGCGLLGVETSCTGKVTGPAALSSVPEPSSVLGLLTFGTLGASSLLQRQMKKRKPVNLTTID